MFLQVFVGKDASCKTKTSDAMMDIEDNTRHLNQSYISFETLDLFVESKLKELEETRNIDSFSLEHWSSQGRIGSPRVKFDLNTNNGSLKIDNENLILSSYCGFSSIKADVALFKGKWMYEVMLGTKGVMQVGWATHKCRFSQEKGVGDTRDSYAYDGNRVRKWNLTTYKYGDTWHCGDVIGCAIDLDNGSVDFYRNGNHLGQAFNRIRVGPGFAYIPSVSLAYNESLTANFGRTPLRYSVPGYQPLEAIPFVDVKKANLLLDWLFKLVIIQTKRDGPMPFIQPPQIHPSVTYYLISNVIMKRLCKLICNQFIIEECLLKKFLFYNQHIHGLLDIFWTLLERSQVYECLDHLVASLMNGYRYSNFDNRSDLCSTLDDPICPHLFSTSSLSYCSIENKSPINLVPQKQYLFIFLSLVQHSKTRSYLLKQVLFDKVKFLQLLVIRAIFNNQFLEEKVFPNLTVCNLTSSDAYKMMKSAEIENSLSELESLHHMILDTLIFQDEICRIIFISKFDSFLKENSSNFNSTRLVNDSFNSMYSLTVTSCVFHRLTSLIRIQYENMVDIVPCSFFVDPTCISHDNNRVGGVLSHLNKTYEAEMTQHSHFISTSSINPLLKHVYILIDGLARLYSTGAHKQLGKYCGVRESLFELSKSIQELEALKDNDEDVCTAIENSTKILKKELLLRARQSALINSTVLTASKRADIYWLLKLILNTLNQASAAGYAFAFVPDYYIESCLNLCYAVRFYFGSSASFKTNCNKISFSPSFTSDQVKEFDDIISQFAIFVASHFGDERVVNADLKENMLQSLASLVSNPDTLKFLEKMPHNNRLKMIKYLTEPYENKAWAQSNWILLRIWKGNGFAYRYAIPPNANSKFSSSQYCKEMFSDLNYFKPCPSTVFQNEIRDYLTSHREVSKAFITSVLSQLNWAFSQFVGMLQEIQNASNRPEKVFFDSRQLKICCTCFDLTIALLRVLEMIVNLNPLLITKADNDLILNQLCTLINQILNRLAVSSGCFEYVVNLDITALNMVAHFPLITAVAGVIIGLVAKGPSESRELALAALVSDASFLPSSILNLNGQSDTLNPSSFQLEDYPEISTEEFKTLSEVVNLMLNKHQVLDMSKYAEDITDEEICTICYANRKTAIFVPCGHQSCR